jgi:phosphatidylinositol glycan class K
MIDTCQANTMYSRLYSPNIIATGSSELDQSSYSHHADNDVGVAVIDRYTYYNLEFLETQVKDLNSRKTVGDLFDSYDYEKIHSNPGFRYDLFPGGADAARNRLITDFFGNIQNVEVDRTQNLTLEEDLLALSKKIALLRQKEAEEETGQKGPASIPAGAPSAETQAAKKPKRFQKTKALSDENWWLNSTLGATALCFCGLIWGLASMIDG